MVWAFATHNFSAPQVLATEALGVTARLVELDFHLVGVVDEGQRLLNLLLGGVLVPDATKGGASVVHAALADEEVGRLRREDEAD